MMANALKKAGKSLKDGATKAATNASALNGKVIDHAEERRGVADPLAREREEPRE